MNVFAITLGRRCRSYSYFIHEEVKSFVYGHVAAECQNQNVHTDGPTPGASFITMSALCCQRQSHMAILSITACHLKKFSDVELCVPPLPPPPTPSTVYCLLSHQDWARFLVLNNILSDVVFP